MRKVRIATVSFLTDDQPHTIARNMDRALAYLEQAGNMKADVVCLPEMVTTANVPPELELTAERFPGEFTRAFRAQARGARINVVAPYLVRAGHRLFNQATVIDRRGTIVGYYRKVQPTAAESRTVTPGNRLPVFKRAAGSGAPCPPGRSPGTRSPATRRPPPL